jgi:SAM-dependent methyltransferase
MDSERRFSDRVADYVRHRPGYPAQIIPLLKRRIGLQPDWRIADVGSGTGLSAIPFLEDGNVVVGVEPNDEMRNAAETLLANWPKFISVRGSAEATGLDDGSVDLVIAGQAFHWFDVQRTRAEFARILKPPRRVVLFWNTRRGETPFEQAYEALLLRHGTDYQQVRHDRDRGDALETFFGNGYERVVLPNEQVMDLEGLRGRLLSTSYTPAQGDARRAPMLDELTNLFRTHQQDGQVRLQYDTEVFAGEIGP